jgi:hypothetical protein
VVHPLVRAIPRFIQMGMPLPPLKPMGQSRRGVLRIGEAHRVMKAQAHPLIMAIPRFIQLSMPLPPLKPMEQSQRGVTHSMEAQVRLLVVAILRFIQLAKAPSVE